MLKKLFEENSKAPKETIITGTKTYNYSQLFGSCIYLIISTYLFFQSTAIVYKIILILICGYLVYVNCLNLKAESKKTKIRLKIDANGIYITSGKIINWSEIEKFEIISKPNYSSSSSEDYLILFMKNYKEEIFLNELNISNQKLNYLLKIYKNRNLNI